MKQFNVRLPKPTISRINDLAGTYGSQAKAVIAAVEQLHTKERMMTVKNTSGKHIDFDVAVNMMDDEIREELHAKITPCSQQRFFVEYCAEHTKKFGEEFELNKRNPTF